LSQSGPLFLSRGAGGEEPGLQRETGETNVSGRGKCSGEWAKNGKGTFQDKWEVFLSMISHILEK